LNRDGLLVRLAEAGRVVATEPKVVEALAATLPIRLRPEPSAGDALGLVIARLQSGANDILSDANYLRRTDLEIFSKPASTSSIV
jgi:tRNA threonylcarbamoyladenosine biosynthesis protein TsaB